MLKRSMLMKIFRAVARERALSYVMGVLMLIMGLLIVLTHLKGGTILTTVITFLGWGVLFEAGIFLFSSAETLAKYLNTLENKKVYYIIMAGYLFLGMFLFYGGFLMRK